MTTEQQRGVIQNNTKLASRAVWEAMDAHLHNDPSLNPPVMVDLGGAAGLRVSGLGQVCAWCISHMRVPCVCQVCRHASSTPPVQT